MQIGVGVSLTRSAGSGGFNVATLFAAGEQGLVAIPSNLSGMYQDSGMTSPVTAAGQTVVKMLDASGRGNTITFTDVTVQIDDYGYYYLDFNGTSSVGVTGSVALTATDKLTVWAAVKPDVVAGYGIVRFGNISSQTGTFELQTSAGAPLMYRRGSGAFGARSVPSIGILPTVMSVSVNLAGATQATECPLFRTNGSQGAFSDAGTADTGSGNFATFPFTIGTQFTGANFLNGRIYGLIIRGAASTQTEIENGEAYLYRNCPPYYAFSHTPVAGDFWDTLTPVSAGAYLETSAFAHVDYTTTATRLEVDSNDQIHANFPDYGEVGVYVNGALYQVLESPAGGPYTSIVTLPAGTKTVSFVNGLQSKPTTLQGTYFVTVRSNAAMTALAPAATNRVLVYGDSIAVGANSSNPVSQGWAMLTRYRYGSNSFAMEGYGFRSLFDDCVDAPARTAFVAKISTWNPSRIWIAIGTNDYGLNKWSAASFGTAYAALLDAIHTALPSATIFCQTPLTRSSEVANGSGSTMGDYRTQIATAVGTRGSYCTLVNGTAILSNPTDFDDSVHPSTAGHAKYATYVQTALGI